MPQAEEQGDVHVGPLTDKVILIVGGSDGVGLESARQLARGQPAKIIITSRTEAKAARAAKHLQERTGYAGFEPEAVQLDSLASVKAFADRILAQESRLDVLMLNAGVSQMESMSVTQDGINSMFQVNVLSHHLLVRLLTPLLLQTPAKPARLVMTSSHASMMVKHLGIDEADKPTSVLIGSLPMGVYGRTKLFNIMQCIAYSREYDSDKIMTYSLHPGFVKTNISAGFGFVLRTILNVLAALFALSPAQGAVTQTYLASSDDVAHVESGLYWEHCKPVRFNGLGKDPAAQKALLAKCDALVADYVK